MKTNTFWATEKPNLDIAVFVFTRVRCCRYNRTSSNYSWIRTTSLPRKMLARPSKSIETHVSHPPFRFLSNTAKRRVFLGCRKKTTKKVLPATADDLRDGQAVYMLSQNQKQRNEPPAVEVLHEPLTFSWHFTTVWNAECPSAGVLALGRQAAQILSGEFLGHRPESTHHENSSTTWWGARVMHPSRRHFGFGAGAAGAAAIVETRGPASTLSVRRHSWGIPALGRFASHRWQALAVCDGRLAPLASLVFEIAGESTPSTLAVGMSAVMAAQPNRRCHC